MDIKKQEELESLYDSLRNDEDLNLAIKVQKGYAKLELFQKIEEQLLKLNEDKKIVRRA